MDSSATWDLGQIFTQGGVAVLLFALFWRMMDLYSKADSEKYEALRGIAQGLLELLKKGGRNEPP